MPLHWDETYPMRLEGPGEDIEVEPNRAAVVLVFSKLSEAVSPATTVTGTLAAALGTSLSGVGAIISLVLLRVFMIVVMLGLSPTSDCFSGSKLSVWKYWQPQRT